MYMRYNITVDKDTDIVLYLNTSVRNIVNKVGDIYSVKVNGVEINAGDATMPYEDANGWFANIYTRVGEARLLAGQNNVIEITRLNLGSKDAGGDKTYNFFGIGIAPLTEANVALSAPCAHICPVCGGCTDAESEELVCANKCDGCTEFTVMDDSVKVVDIDGGTVGKNTAQNEQNISANNSSVGKGYYKVTYNIHSDKDITVKLYIKTCAQQIQNSVNDSYKFTVNNNAVTVGETLMMPFNNETSKWNDKRYTCIGEIQLKEGDNAIVIERPDMSDRDNNDYTGYNFFGIALSGDAALTFVK